MDIIKTLVLAVERCRRAAEQNDASAQHALANMYFTGFLLERNILLAEQWNDRALANPARPDPDMKSMQMYMLAERLRRVKAAPILEGVQVFRYDGPTPADLTDLHSPTHSYNLCCEGCSGPIPIDARKKFCSGCNIAAYCCRVCQKADWKRHKKVCGKKPNETHRLMKVGKEKYKEDLNVVRDYVPSVPGLARYLRLLAYIHWNDSPLIGILTTAGTDGMNPTVFVIPRIVWESEEPSQTTLANFYKDGPRKDLFICEHSLNHLGPELAEQSEAALTHMTMQKEQLLFHPSDPKFYDSAGVTSDLAVRMAKHIQMRDLVDLVRKRTTLPTSVDEMNAFYNFHLEMVNANPPERAQVAPCE